MLVQSSLIAPAQYGHCPTDFIDTTYIGPLLLLRDKDICRRLSYWSLDDVLPNHVDRGLLSSASHPRTFLVKLPVLCLILSYNTAGVAAFTPLPAAASSLVMSWRWSRMRCCSLSPQCTDLSTGVCETESSSEQRQRPLSWRKVFLRPRHHAQGPWTPTLTLLAPSVQLKFFQVTLKFLSLACPR